MRRMKTLAVLTTVGASLLAAWGAHAQTAPAAPAAKPAPAAAAAPTAPAAPAVPAAAVVAVKTVEPMLALVLPMKGSYAQHGSAFAQLGSAFGSLGVAPAGAPFARYLSDASQVAEADLIWEVAFPLSQKVTVTAPFECKEIPGGLVAVVVQDGPYEVSAEAAFRTLMGWLMTSGYRPAGAPMAIFQGDVMSGADARTEARLPVEKVQ